MGRFRTDNASACVLLVVVLLSQAMGHPPEEHQTGGDKHKHAKGSHHSSSLLLPMIKGSAKPWSEQPILNTPERFHFAVVTDRTGGHRPGVWMHAVRNLNLLRPEFVVSVGDLIEGYTEDVDAIQAQWNEFLGFIDQLDMKFFFVAGNHDVTNPTMHRIWREHFGREWYSFDYKGVHFLCLLSEDPSAHIGDEQLQWALEDLDANRDARWTFVFMHKPLWVYAEREMAAGNPDQTQWKQIENALRDRPHTVFAGHVHHYAQFKRNDAEFYHLATTGGGSRLRGIPYGEFDHIVWVTMEKETPRIANILLDGVLAPDAVTEEKMLSFREFLEETQIRVSPVLVAEDEGVQSAEFEVSASNQFEDPVQISARVSGLPLEGLSLEPAELHFDLATGDQQSTAVRFDLSESLPFARFRNTVLTAQLRSGELAAELTIPVTIDRRHMLVQQIISVDGELLDWDENWLSMPQHPSMFGPSQQWQGKTDGAFEFQFANDGNYLYCAGKVFDDQVLPSRDRMYFGIDTRDIESRLATPRQAEGCYTLELIPPGNDATGSIRVDARNGSNPEFDIQVCFDTTDSGYKFEFAIPVQILEGENKPWSSFQLNAVMRDVDEVSDGDLYLLWRPTSDLGRDNTGYAHFFNSQAAP